MTGVLPASGAGARIWGSMSAGGHNTPLDFASRSESGSLAWPVVVPSGAMVPRGGTGFDGVQSLMETAGESGVVAVGGACAAASAIGHVSAAAQARSSACFAMLGKRRYGTRVPRVQIMISGFPIADQGEMPHRRHRPALGESNATMFGGPVGQARPGKFRTPAEPARQRRKSKLEGASRA